MLTCFVTGCASCVSGSIFDPFDSNTLVSPKPELMGMTKDGPDGIQKIWLWSRKSPVPKRHAKERVDPRRHLQSHGDYMAADIK